MFTTSAYIRKNTPELRERLRELGYKVLPMFTNFPCLSVSNGIAIPADGLNRDGHFDCTDNETLFLAIAALRNDSDYMQWFCNYRGENWVQCTEQVCRGSREWHTEQGILHKASVEELVKHFSK